MLVVVVDVCSSYRQLVGVVAAPVHIMVGRLINKRPLRQEFALSVQLPQPVLRQISFTTMIMR